MFQKLGSRNYEDIYCHLKRAFLVWATHYTNEEKIFHIFVWFTYIKEIEYWIKLKMLCWNSSTPHLRIVSLKHSFIDDPNTLLQVFITPTYISFAGLCTFMKEVYKVYIFCFRKKKEKRRKFKNSALPSITSNSWKYNS